MNQGQQKERIRQILEEMNMGSLVSTAQELDDFLGRLEDFFVSYGHRARHYKSRGLPTTLDLQAFLREYDDNSHRVGVMLQAVASLCTPQMLAMMWMVLLGSTIKTLAYAYEHRGVSRLAVDLLLPDGRTLEHFESGDHWDTAILRFMGISKTHEAPVIESFYPSHIPKKTD